MKEPLRIRLARTKTIPEIEAMIADIRSDSEAKEGASGIDIYNTKTMKRMDEMTWAIYSIRKRQKANI